MFHIISIGNIGNIFLVDSTDEKVDWTKQTKTRIEPYIKNASFHYVQTARPQFELALRRIFYIWLYSGFLFLDGTLFLSLREFNLKILGEKIWGRGQEKYNTSPNSSKDKWFHLQPKTAPPERKYPIFVALERGLNVSIQANIQPTAIESQI